LMPSDAPCIPDKLALKSVDDPSTSDEFTLGYIGPGCIKEVELIGSKGCG